jgi:putative DNA primase/helicase
MQNTNGSAPKMRDFDPKTEAEGKWSYIFGDLLPELSEAMEKAGHHVSCPVHGGSDGFRLFKDFNTTGGGYCNSCGPQANGFALMAWMRGYAFKDAVREVAQWVRGDKALPTPIKRAPIAAPKPEDFTFARDYISRVWAASKPIKGTPGELYLDKRGIFPENIPSSLRFHPGLKYLHGKEKLDMGTFPCLLAPIKDKNGLILSIHRIFLTDTGDKAPVPDAKKMMPKCGYLGGSAIKLYAPGDVLGVAEGIETALAVRAISRMPVWSCVSAKLLELVDIPDSVRHVVIWGDLDLSCTGEKSAAVLSERLVTLGKTVEICLPKTAIPTGVKGVDWLDVLLAQGIEGFPEHWRNYVIPA